MEEPASDKRVWELSKSKYWKFVSGFLALILSAIFLYNIVFGAAGSSFLHNLFSAVGGPETKFKLVGQITIAPNSGSGEMSTPEGETDKSSKDFKITPNINSKIGFSRTMTQNQSVEKKSDKLIPQDGAATSSNHKISRQTINTTSTTQVVEKRQTATSSEAKQTISSPETPADEVFKQCGFATSSEPPTHQKLIINEIAWMGGATSTNDEWIELKNISSTEIDLSGWQLFDKDEQIKINLSVLANPKIVPGGFILLERTNDDSVPNIAANLIYVGALSNTDEGLRLFDSQCVLADEAGASPDWLAGNNADKRTMERDNSGFGWHTSNSPGGTPKQTNSEPVVSYSGGGTATIAVSEPQVSVSTITQPSPTPVKILISEIQAGTDAAANDEFVELYNPTTQAIDLTNWSIKKKTSTGSESTLLVASHLEGIIILSHHYLLVANASATLTVAPDVSWPKSYTLAYSQNAVMLYDVNGAKIDEASWTEIPKNQSFERRALKDNACVSASGAGELLGNDCDTDSESDFEIRNIPNPQNSGSSPEP